MVLSEERKLKKVNACKKIITELDKIEVIKYGENEIYVPEEIKLSFMELVTSFMQTNSLLSTYCYHDTEAYSIHESLSFNDDDTVDILITTIDIPMQKREEKHIKEVDQMLLKYIQYLETKPKKNALKELH